MRVPQFFGTTTGGSLTAAQQLILTKDALSHTENPAFYATTGEGSETSPYLDGIQAAIDKVAARRGGKVELDADVHKLTSEAGIVISSRGIHLTSTSLGGHQDPIGTSEGMNYGHKILVSKIGIHVLGDGNFNPGVRIGGLVLDKLHLHCTTPQQTGSAAGKTIGLWLDAYPDQPIYEHLNISNFDTAVLLNGFHDLAFYKYINVDGCRVGFYYDVNLNTATREVGTGLHQKFVKCTIADMARHGVIVAGNSLTAGDPSNDRNVYFDFDCCTWVHCCNQPGVQADNPCGAYFDGAFSIFRGGSFIQSGYNQLAKIGYGADGLILGPKSFKNIVTGVTFRFNGQGATGYGIRIRGSYNEVDNCTWEGNVSGDIILESTSTNNIIRVPKGTTVIDNGTDNRVTYY